MTLNRILILFLFGLELWTAAASAWSCRSDFEDIASRAVLSAVVFQGRARRRLMPAGNASEQHGSSSSTTRIVFRVVRVLKGTLGNGTSVLAVGPFKDFADPANCVASTTSIALGASYVVFVGNETSSASSSSSSSLAANGQSTSRRKSRGRRRKESGIPEFTISGRPETSRPEVVATVGRYSCSNCLRSPVALISPAEASSIVGQRLRLHCRTSGNPEPVVTWFKDGSPVTESAQRQIRIKGRSSRLQIRSMTGADFGVYQCFARNVLGVSNVSSCSVAMKQGTSTVKPHAVHCVDQSFCLNGGSCFIITQLNIQFCQCRVGYEGKRCQIKDTGIRGAVLSREEVRNNPETDPKTLVFATAGAVVIGVILSLIAVSLFKRLCWEKAKYRFDSSDSSYSSTVSPYLAKDDSKSNRLRVESPSYGYGRQSVTSYLDACTTTTTSSSDCRACAAIVPAAATVAIRRSADDPTEEPGHLQLSSASLSSAAFPPSSSFGERCLIVPRPFHRRRRLQAVSESFDCDDES